MSKDAPYFSHDYNASNDPNLQNLFMVYGCKGIGAFWIIVEMIYNNGGEYPRNIKLIANRINEPQDWTENVIRQFKLFYFKGGMIRSHSIDRRLAIRAEKIEAARRAGRASGKARKERPLNARSTTDELDRLGRIETIDIKKLPRPDVALLANTREPWGGRRFVRNIPIEEIKQIYLKPRAGQKLYGPFKRALETRLVMELPA